MRTLALALASPSSNPNPNPNPKPNPHLTQVAVGLSGAHVADRVGGDRGTEVAVGLRGEEAIAPPDRGTQVRG